MVDGKKNVYDESKIKTLSSLEHIRLRTGMYIGRIGDGSHYDDGCYILLKEVIDNAIDEYIMGHGKEVQITIEDNNVTVRDFGPGLPKDEPGKVFDHFFSTKQTGMGLTIVQSIIKTHAENIRAENLRDRGARFFFRLPAARKPQIWAA